MRAARWLLIAGLALVECLPAAAKEGLSLSAAARDMPDRERMLQGYRETLQEGIVGGILFPDGVSPAARSKAPGFVREMLARMPLPRLQRLAACGPRMVIVPDGVMPSRLPPLDTLPEERKHRLDADWHRKKGKTLRLPDGTSVAIVNDWNFNRGEDRGRPEEHIVVHEWAHVVDNSLLEGNAGEELTDRLYEERLREGRFPSQYADRNRAEYFAVSVTFWFDLYGESAETRRSGIRGADWIRRFDPEMYALLKSLFGPPRSLAP